MRCPDGVIESPSFGTVPRQVAFPTGSQVGHFAFKTGYPAHGLGVIRVNDGLRLRFRRNLRDIAWICGSGDSAQPPVECSDRVSE